MLPSRKKTSSSYSFSRGTFGLQVYPSREWLTVPIDPVYPLTRDNTKGTISVKLLYEYTKEVIEAASGLEEGLPDEGIAYHVNVIRPRVGKVALEKLLDITKYLNYIDEDTGNALIALINDAANRLDSVLTVEIALFEGSRVIIFPSIRDMVPLLYQMPPLPDGLGYEISIFMDKPGELEALAEYTKFVVAENEKLKPQSLALAVPMAEEAPGEFLPISRIIFVARRQGQVIGYCACVLIPYRTEITELTELAISAALDKHSPYKDRFSSVLDRYLMNVRPGNVFEIEGLSVSPQETGKKVGLALLYQALSFVVAPRVQCLYQMSHVGSQAASYITKRYLVGDFKFRYHGGNNFMNETFLETLSGASKKKLTRVVKDLIGYYNLFFEQSKTLNSHLAKTDAWVKPVGEMFTNVISLYQLYYLLLKAVRPGEPSPVDDETLARFYRLFDSLTMALASASPLKEYFRKSRDAVSLYGRDRDREALKQLADTIMLADEITVYDEDDFPIRPRYGFMAGPNLKLPDTKTPYNEGYDVIYAALPNVIQLGQLLEVRLRANIAKLTLDEINELLMEDLPLPYNYELAQPQVDRLLELLKQIAQDRLLSNEIPAIKAMTTALQRKKTLLKSNTKFNSVFTSQLYYISAKLTSGFDTFISVAFLQQQWPSIEESVKGKLAAQLPPQGMEVEVPLPLLGREEEIPLPADKDALATEIRLLYDLFTLYYGSKEPVIIPYKGKEYALMDLAKYFNTLVIMELTQGPFIEILDSEEEYRTMEVEGGFVYDIEEFIDEEDEELDLGGEENLLNRVPI